MCATVHPSIEGCAHLHSYTYTFALGRVQTVHLHLFCTLAHVSFDIKAGTAISAKLYGMKNFLDNGESRSLFEAKVSCFPSVSGSGAGKSLSLWSIICGLTSGKWRDAVEAVRNETDEAKRKALKQGLPCFAPSGTFSGRKAADMTAHNGFICIDLDDKDNCDPAFDRLKELLPSCPNVAFCARSVGGKGYFCLVPIAAPAKHRAYFRALCHDFKQCGLTVDRSGADVCRKRFVTYDPAPYINTGAEVYDYTYDEEERPEARRLNGEIPEEARSPLMLALLDWASAQKRDLTGDYPQWFEMLCALASTFGEDGREYAQRLSKYGGKYNPGDTDRQYDECLKHGGYAYNFGTILYYARKEMGDAEFGRVMLASDFSDLLDKING